jgi:hypothetical protein
MAHRPLDPSKVNVAIDANAFNRDGGAHDQLVDRVLKLGAEGKIRLIAPQGVRREVEDLRTPSCVQEAILPQIFTIPTDLTDQERANRRKIEAALQGNAKPGKHAADAAHVFEAGKYCGYFITHDERILKRAGSYRELPPSFKIVTLARFLEIFDDYEAAALQRRRSVATADVCDAQVPLREEPGMGSLLAARAAEKAHAVEAIEYALSAVEGKGRAPDSWEQECLVEAIGALFRGLYSLASVNAENALTPADQRCAVGLAQDRLSQCDLPSLSRAFAIAAAEPVRQVGHLGPIIFAGASE